MEKIKVQKCGKGRGKKETGGRDRSMVFLMVLQMGKWNTAGFRRLDVGMPWVEMTGLAVNINKIPYIYITH